MDGDDVYKLEIRVKLMAFSLYFSRKASMSSAWGRLHLRTQLGSSTKLTTCLAVVVSNYQAANVYIYI